MSEFELVETRKNELLDLHKDLAEFERKSEQAKTVADAISSVLQSTSRPYNGGRYALYNGLLVKVIYSLRELAIIEYKKQTSKVQVDDLRSF